MRNDGWRKPTPALARANALAKTGEELAVSRNRAIVACKRVAAALGLRAGDLLVLDALAAFSHVKDWEKGARPIVWPSNDFLMARTGLSLSAVKRRSNRLCELGLISYRDSSNGKRYGYRDAHGRIVEAYGFDLAPLAARTEEFEALHEQLQEERALCCALKRKITIARRTVRALIDTAMEQYLSGSWKSLLARLQALINGIVTQRACADQLATAYEAFDALLQETESAFKLACQSDQGDTNLAAASQQSDSKTTKLNPKEPNFAPHILITTESQNVKSNSHEKLNEQVEPRQQPEVEIEDDTTTTADGSTMKQPPTATHPIGLPVIMQACPGFADMARGVQPYLNSWRDLEYVADRLRPAIGISEDAWITAKRGLGGPMAAAAFALITDKYSDGEVSSPGGYLRGLIGKAQRGELNLERSFYGRLGAKADVAVHTH